MYILANPFASFAGMGGEVVPASSRLAIVPHGLTLFPARE